MAQKILVADDDERMRNLVRDYLLKDGYEVLTAPDGNSALDIFYATSDIALVILDIMMPGIDGLEVAREIRTQKQTPIILLTARDQEQDELKGFEIGVDEYISKPFSPRVLMARVEALLRRSYPNSANEILTAGSISLDKQAHRVMIDGQEADLSFKEFELLAYFLENQGIALTRDNILNRVWNYDYFGDARTIDTHVKKLRAKMGKSGAMIKTIWGVGYKFESEKTE